MAAQVQTQYDLVDQIGIHTHINAPPVYRTSGIIVLPFLSFSGLISKAKRKVTKAMKIIFSAR